MPPEKILSAADIGALQSIVRDRCGLEVRPGKEVLLESRFRTAMQRLGVADSKTFLEALYQGSSPEVDGLVEALLTHHTAFWREPNHFDLFRTLVLEGAGAAGRVRVWCAAASSGEEAYSLAMAAWEVFGPGTPQRFELLATDVSNHVLARARRATYPLHALEPLPPRYAERYFLRGCGPARGLVRVKPAVRSLVSFSRINLVEPLPHIGPFTAIFCRNAMIYFDPATRLSVAQNLFALLKPGGYIFVGHAESLSTFHLGVEYIGPAVYRRTGEIA